MTRGLWDEKPAPLAPISDLGDPTGHLEEDMPSSYMAGNVEAAASAESLEELHTFRRTLLEANAEIIAIHGSFGMYDDFRKQRLDAEKVRIRNDIESKLKPGDKRPTNDAVEEMAHECAPYKAFLDKCLSDKITVIKVQNQITEINERIRNRDQVLYHHAAELRLTSRG